MDNEYKQELQEELSIETIEEGKQELKEREDYINENGEDN